MSRFYIAFVMLFMVSYAHAAEYSLKLGSREFSCVLPNGKAEIQTDYNLPSEGGSATDDTGDTVLILNPQMLSVLKPVVQWFVFTHECGHLNKPDDGGTELEADTYAIENGIDQGWLTKADLQDVCNSWEDAPETDDHPSGAIRCANLDKHFNEYLATKTPKVVQKPIVPPPVIKVTVRPVKPIRVHWYDPIVDWFRKD